MPKEDLQTSYKNNNRKQNTKPRKWPEIILSLLIIIWAVKMWLEAEGPGSLAEGPAAVFIFMLGLALLTNALVKKYNFKILMGIFLGFALLITILFLFVNLKY